MESKASLEKRIDVLNGIVLSLKNSNNFLKSIITMKEEEIRSLKSQINKKTAR